MAGPRRLTALALARALQAGPPTAQGLLARLQACLGQRAEWGAALVEPLARPGAQRWRHFSVAALATHIERDPGFQRAWHSSMPPFVRRYVQRSRTALHPRPLGLERCLLPLWPHLGALAAGLGLPSGGLWRLSKPAAWQRRAPLAQQHYHCQLLAKPRGGWRLLEVPQPHLMALQRQLLDRLLAAVPAHEAAMAWRPGRSVRDHAAAHAGQAVLLKFDLQDFFPSVRASRVQALFTTLGYPDAVARALTALCTTATPEPVLRRLHAQGGLGWAQLQRLRDAHLPQGAPTSPALANLCALGLDRRLQGLAETLGARYTRYADDLVFSGPPALREARQRIAAWVAHIAAEEGFALNHRKTRCQGAAQRQAVCGVVVNQHPNLRRSDFDRLKATLHGCARDGPWVHNREGHADWQGHLRGRLAWAAQLNPAKAQKLQRLWQQIDWAVAA
jgi:hypothetical protein